MRASADRALARLDAAARRATARALAATVSPARLGEALHGTSAGVALALILAGIGGLVAAPRDPLDVALSLACLGLSLLVWVEETCSVRALLDATSGADRDRALAHLAAGATSGERRARVGLLLSLPAWGAAAPFAGGTWAGLLLVALPLAFLAAFYVRTAAPADLQGR